MLLPSKITRDTYYSGAEMTPYCGKKWPTGLLLKKKKTVVRHIQINSPACEKLTKAKAKTTARTVFEKAIFQVWFSLESVEWRSCASTICLDVNFKWAHRTRGA